MWFSPFFVCLTTQNNAAFGLVGAINKRRKDSSFMCTRKENPCKNIYSIEGRFIEQLEMLQPHQAGVRMWDPDLARAYFLPVSDVDLRKYVYEPHPHSYAWPSHLHIYMCMLLYMKRKHPFWESRSISFSMIGCNFENIFYLFLRKNRGLARIWLIIAVTKVL